MTSSSITLPALPVASREDDERTALSSLPPGSEAVIAGLRESSAVSRRLADLGFLEGTRVRVLRRAPLGDPLVFELRGYRICLRSCEADVILVHPGPEKPRKPLTRRAAGALAAKAGR